MPPTAHNRQTRHPGALALVVLLALLFVAVLIIGNSVFVVKAITVEGIMYCTKEEVIKAAGIQLGDSIFSIDAAKVREGVNANRFLSYQSIWRDYPNHVIIRVEEYAPRAALTWKGTLAKISKEGVVLEESSQIDGEIPVPLITGAKIENMREGRAVTYSVAGQAGAIENLLDALDYQGITSEVSELNIAELDNLYLVTYDGLQVVLGNDENMRNKIALMQIALSELRGSEDIRGGVLNVTTGVTADYRPAPSGQ